MRKPEPVARYLDAKWKYHPAASHHNASKFRTRLRAYGKPPAQPHISNVEIVTQLRRKAKA